MFSFYVFVSCHTSAIKSCALLSSEIQTIRRLEIDISVSENLLYYLRMRNYEIYMKPLRYRKGRSMRFYAEQKYAPSW